MVINWSKGGSDLVEEKKSSGSQARNVSQALEQVVREQCAVSVIRGFKDTSG